MAFAASVADVSVVDARVLVGVFEDAMFAMAIGTQRSVGDASREGAAMYTLPELVDDLRMAHTAGIRYRRSKRLGLGRQQFMRTTMAHAAIGGAVVAVFSGLSVDAAGIVASLIHVARGALWLGHIGGMRIFLMVVVTGFARQPRVRAFLQLLCLFVAGNTPRGGDISGMEATAGRSENETQNRGGKCDR
jgi:hypothetical protein